jgi:hypothetical protein
MPNKMNHKSTQIVDEIYLAYVRALSAMPDVDLADLVAEYAAPCCGAAPKERISNKPPAQRNSSNRTDRHGAIGLIQHSLSACQSVS